MHRFQQTSLLDDFFEPCFRFRSVFLAPRSAQSDLGSINRASVRTTAPLEYFFGISCASLCLMRFNGIRPPLAIEPVRPDRGMPAGRQDGIANDPPPGLDQQSPAHIGPADISSPEVKAQHFVGRRFFVVDRPCAAPSRDQSDTPCPTVQASTSSQTIQRPWFAAP